MKKQRVVGTFSVLVLAAAVGLLSGCNLGSEGEGDDSGKDNDSGKDYNTTTGASGVVTGAGTTTTGTTVATWTYTTTLLVQDAYTAPATPINQAIVSPRTGLPLGYSNAAGTVTYTYNTAPTARVFIDVGSSASTSTTSGGVVYAGGYVPETIDFLPPVNGTAAINLLRATTGTLPTIPATAAAVLTVTPSLHNFTVTNTDVTGAIVPSRVELFFTATGTLSPVQYIYDYRGTLLANGTFTASVPAVLGATGSVAYPFATGVTYDVVAVGKDALSNIVAYSTAVPVIW